MKEIEMPMVDKKMKPSMRLDSSDVKDLNDYHPGDKGKMTMNFTMKSKNMEDKGKCSATMEMDNIEMSDEMSEKAEKIGTDRKTYSALMKKRAENKEKMQNENS